jgi:hypothetical protein
LKYFKIYIKISFQKDQPYLIIYYFHLNWIHFYWPIFLNSFLLTIPLLLPQVFSLFPYNIKKININLNLLYLHKKHLSMLQIRQLPIYQEYVNNNGQLIYLQNHFFLLLFYLNSYKSSSYSSSFYSFSNPPPNFYLYFYCNSLSRILSISISSNSKTLSNPK